MADDAPPHTAPATGQPGSSDPRRRLGRLGEDLAAAHLQRLGYAMLARNVRTRHGEIDLIAHRAGVLVFAEVKTARARSQNAPARGPALGPLEWLHPRQRARLRRLAAAWLGERTNARPPAGVIRFDAVGVTVDARDRLLRLEHIEGAW